MRFHVSIGIISFVVHISCSDVPFPCSALISVAFAPVIFASSCVSLLRLPSSPFASPHHMHCCVLGIFNGMCNLLPMVAPSFLLISCTWCICGYDFHCDWGVLR